MRGGLDETLARLARREEARRRRSADPEADDGGPTLAFGATGHPPTTPASPGPGATQQARPGPTATEPTRSAPGPATPAAGELARTGSGWAGPVPAADGDPVEEVAEAVRRVVAARPGLTVVLRVEYAGRTYPLRIEQAQPTARNERPGTGPRTEGPENGARNERPEVGARAGVDPSAAPPPAWPLADQTPPAWTPAREMPGVDPAARLAELIRRDPTLLDSDT
ncbi:hypothetical protein TPA0907_59790 [Micromonospora humidisoli]|uniref:DNA polymerase-3 subunit gamma/tau n=1 Tax=Micromonospora humidisoli TaxID=2807622 RepID=A0ABS2J6K6_9ACTN|nr:MULTISPECIES: hypothetical protein [Micromonospora]MBM7082185.1 hypothetical protein [Micromonospora humidisoli]GHJ11612.1 hypothetical protein TPA0907_59790 [Micromonospora sp. AKA109]